MLDRCIKEGKTVENFDFLPTGNVPQNIVMGLIQDILDVPNSFIIGSFEETVDPTGATHFITGFYENDRNEEDWWKKGPKWLKGLQFEIEYVHDRQYFQDLEFTPFPITDNTGCAVVLGYVYKVDPLSLLEKPDQQKDFLALCEAGDVRTAFAAVKTFYQEVTKKQKVNEYR